ncbi:hypothetical protein PFICI_14254 [Pestalotiopsis fici W106-1]|uniref:Protein RTA1 n=1 Tax=Pestalotiopsis fici (strain W106-1 / CGMCC3.15140) TaxID=1229662 RepID=W3WKI4_PESFW|nr:uncharacterized protein PFICI_14254 [Pestalotiopsis fici W106-1]ETS74388.1 hypothetical protein PFICI_14254 [Pestalotiopsis fici W106-1]
MAPLFMHNNLLELQRRDEQVMSKLYLYDPSLAAACIFIVLFACTAVAHLFVLFKRRTWYFVPFLIGIGCEIIGYAGRALSASQTPNWSVFPYALQSLMLLIAPSFLAASIYGMLGRTIAMTRGEAYSPIPPKKLTKVFVTSDVLSFLVQSGGGGILTNAKSPSSIQLGEKVIIVGLFIQLIGFIFFIGVTGTFHKRITQGSRTGPVSVAAPWRRHIFILYGVSALVFVRSLFRVIEYCQGYDGYLQTTEVFLYVFDAALMFVVTVVLAIDYPNGEETGFEEVKSEPEGPLELRNLIPGNVHSMQQWEGPSPTAYRGQSARI